MAGRLAGHGVAVLIPLGVPGQAEGNGPPAAVEVLLGEPGPEPLLVTRPGLEGVDDAADRVIGALEARGLLAPTQDVDSADEADLVASHLEALGYLG